MPSLESIMQNSLSAMFAAQAGLTTVSRNIANANTPGYSRQQAVLSSRRPLVLTFGSIGQGVEVANIRRIQDEFLLANLRKQTSRSASYSMTDSTLYEIETILGSVDNDHLGDALNSFFSAWSDLANPPQDPGLKTFVLSQAQSLVADFHAINQSLDDVATGIELAVQAEIAGLNDRLAQVAALNKQVMAAEIGGPEANDLRDRRDTLITEIAAIAEVTVLERDDGSKDLILAGRTMVTRQSYQQLTTRYERDGDDYRMTVLTGNTLREIELSEGRLEGLLTARDVHLRETRDQLDEIARLLIDSVNDLHSQGSSGDTRGLPFFVGDSIGTIDVAEAIKLDPSLIAYSRSGLPGDNDIALAIAALGEQGLGGPGDPGINKVYRDVIIDLAGKRSSYEFLVDNQRNVVASVEAKIASVSGVSMDEEGANMVRYQTTYNAAAKVIATVQELYDTLLRMI